jgi:hypothetical protein
MTCDTHVMPLPASVGLISVADPEPTIAPILSVGRDTRITFR